MPPLSRKAPHLLRNVAGHAHATDEDHERDPESSSDELGLSQSSTKEKSVHTEDNISPPSKRKGAKRKAEVVVDKPQPLKKQKSADDLLFAETSAMGQPRRKAKNVYGGTKYGQHDGPLKNIHAETKKGSERGKLKGKENVDPRSAKLFKSPPKSSPIIPTIQEPSKFRVPPNISLNQPSKNEIGVKFKQPPSATLPSTRSGRITRSKARSITPESSQPIDIASSPLNSVTPSSPLEPQLEEDSTCPTCNMPVPEELMDEWRARYPKMSIRIQQAFCREHTGLSAKEAWAARHPDYPSIIDVDWKGLDQRIQNLRSEMMWLIERPERSFFRERFERTVVDTGRSRTLLKDIIGSRDKSFNHRNATFGPEDSSDNSGNSVGYYGTNGLKRMYVSPEIAMVKCN
jgi:hypothetical protein